MSLPYTSRTNSGFEPAWFLHKLERDRSPGSELGQSVLMPLLESCLNVILPTPCVFCGKRGAPVCRLCGGAVTFQLRETSRDFLHGWTVTDYGDSEKLLLKAFKEHELTALSGYLGRLLAPALREIANGLLAPHPDQTVTLVPIPSSRANYVKRGFTPAKLLAAHANRLAGRPLVVRSLLRFSRVVDDQSKLNIEQRRANLAGSMTANRAPSGIRVLLFDDVVTTGATLLEAARALTEAGAEVLGFVTFSETLLKTHTKS